MAFSIIDGKILLLIPEKHGFFPTKWYGESTAQFLFAISKCLTDELILSVVGSITNFSQQSQENDAQDPHDLGDFETFCDFTTSSGTSSATNDVHDDADLLLSDGINFADELRRRCVNDVHRFQTLLAMIRALQRRGKETELRARLNTPDSHNNLLLHQALSSSRIDEFILLLTNGADPNQKSIDNKTAWSIVNSRATDYRIELSPFLIIQIMHFVNFCAMNKDSRLSIDIGLTYKIGKDRKEIEFKTKTLTYVELLGYLSRWEPLSDPSAQPSYRIHVPSTNVSHLPYKVLSRY